MGGWPGEKAKLKPCQGLGVQDRDLGFRVYSLEFRGFVFKFKVWDLQTGRTDALQGSCVHVLGTDKGYATNPDKPITRIEPYQGSK